MNKPSAVGFQASALSPARFGGQRRDHRFQHHQAVGRSHERIGGAFRVRHQSQNVAACIQDSGDVPERPVRVIEVAKDDPVFRLEPVERFFVRVIATLAVGDGKSEPAPFRRRM